MGIKCIVPKCDTGKKKTTQYVSQFRAPANFMQRKAWARLIGLDRELTINDFVCAKHFLLKDIISIVTTSGVVPKIIPKLKKGAKPVLLPELPVKSQRRKRSRTSKVEVSVTPQVVQDDDTHSIALSQNSNSKSKCKSLSDDPLIIKYENVPEMEMSEPYETTDIKYIDPQTFINDIMITEELQVLRQRVSELEYQNIQLKHKNSELSNSLNYAETEKKQLRAELDTAVLANRKLVIVKTSLVNTIQNLGKSIGAVTQTILPIDPTLDLSDTIVGI